MVNICLKIITIPINGATGPSARKIPDLKAHLKRKEPSDENESYALEAGHGHQAEEREPHSVIASAREHKDDDNDDADEDDGDGSGAN